MTKRFNSVKDMLDDLYEDPKERVNTKAFINSHRLSRILVLCRNKSGKSQQDVAKLTGWSQGKVSKLEHQPDTSFTVGDIEKYANSVGMRIEIGFTPHSWTLPDKAKHHYSKMRSVLDRISGIADGDAAIQAGVNKFMGEASMVMLQAAVSCMKAVKPTELDKGILVSIPEFINEPEKSGEPVLVQ